MPDSGLEEIEPYLGPERPVPPGWQPIAAMPLLIMVGGMGAGKSTTVNALAAAGCAFRLLPNRRTLTNLLIVAPLQREDNLPAQILDRTGRLPYIRRYRERYPAGLAHAIADLFIRLDHRDTTCNHLLVFDGLRGEDEIRYAVEALPLARYVMLNTPDIVRIERILERRDPYDRFSSEPWGGNPSFRSDAVQSFAAIGEPGAATVFTAEEEQRLVAMVREGYVSVDEMRDKLRLIVTERSLYRLEDTMAALEALAPERTHVIDTTRYSPAQIAQEIMSDLRQAGVI
jgi:hypothetical protein